MLRGPFFRGHSVVALPLTSADVYLLTCLVYVDFGGLALEEYVLGTARGHRAGCTKRDSSPGLPTNHRTAR